MMNKYKNQVFAYINDNDCPIIFDFDGTLSSYNYGEYTCHHDLDTPENEEEFILAHIYKNAAKPIPVIQQFLRDKNPSDIYVLSCEPHGQEEDKQYFAEKYYGIPRKNCYFVKAREEKVEKLKELRSRFEESTPVYIDDDENVLRLVEKQTDYITAHITLFFETIPEERTKKQTYPAEDGQFAKKIIYPAFILVTILLFALIITLGMIFFTQGYSYESKPEYTITEEEEEPVDTEELIKKTPKKVTIIDP